MQLFHRTNDKSAIAILREVFRDSSGTWGISEWMTGVWFSADYPLDENEGAHGEVVLMLNIPEDAIAEFE